MQTRQRADDGHAPGLTTRALAGLCHQCGICPFAARRPESTFEKVMRWHRTWCPAWKAHTRVYGEKQLAQ
jgi:hypothetical protein